LLEKPRFTVPVPGSGQTLWLEGRLHQLYAADLQSRGELLKPRDLKNAVQVVEFRDGRFVAAADPRKGGDASVGLHGQPSGTASADSHAQ